MTKKIAVIVGSLRQASINRKFARAVMAAAPAELQLEFLEIAPLQMYNQDLDDAGGTPEWQAFRDAIRAADGVIFFTPEYNRSVPGALKNAIDIGSRPSGKSAWGGKPAAVVSVSPGMLSGFGANNHLRQMLVALNMPCLPQPEMYIGQAGTLMDEAGTITNEKTAEMIVRFLAAYGKFLTALSS